MGQLAACLKQKDAHAARTVVLVPYAQLMQQARAAWATHAQSLGAATAFVPRFETTMNWASATPGFTVSPEDIRLDAAIDALTAASLLHRAGLGAQAGGTGGFAAGFFGRGDDFVGGDENAEQVRRQK